MAALPLFLIIYLSLILLLPYNGLVSLAINIPEYYRSDFRRIYNHLHPNARMPLYGDILSNGYYATKLYVGTPPHEFKLIVDTGSSMTFVPCGQSDICGEHENPPFEPESSISYEPVKCDGSCDCDYPRSQCSYKIEYVEGSYSEGVLAEDIISFGNENEFAPQRLLFGCQVDAGGFLYRSPADGIIGLGRSANNIVDQLVQKRVISDSFSLCYGGMDVGGGQMILGGFSPLPSDMVFTYSNPARSQHYNIELMDMEIAGKPLELNPTIFNRSDGTVLDSGTTYAFFPENAFTAFKIAILNETSFLERTDGPDPNIDDICFSCAGREAISNVSKIFPEVNFVFSNHQKLSLSPENYLFRHRNVTGAYCLGIYQNENKEDQTIYLGGIIVRNTLVTYDRQNNRIGFWKTNCSELWERLDIATFGMPTGGFTPGEYQSSCDKEDSAAANQEMHDEL